MADAYPVIVAGFPDIRELIFELPPRLGETVSLPDLDGDRHFVVERVTHSARLPHSNEVPKVRFLLNPKA